MGGNTSGMNRRRPVCPTKKLTQKIGKSEKIPYLPRRLRGAAKLAEAMPPSKGDCVQRRQLLGDITRRGSSCDSVGAMEAVVNAGKVDRSTDGIIGDEVSGLAGPGNNCRLCTSGSPPENYCRL